MQAAVLPMPISSANFRMPIDPEDLLAAPFFEPAQARTFANLTR
jgi:hypothetical protein